MGLEVQQTTLLKCSAALAAAWPPSVSCNLESRRRWRWQVWLGLLTRDEHFVADAVRGRSVDRRREAWAVHPWLPPAESYNAVVSFFGSILRSLIDICVNTGKNYNPWSIFNYEYSGA